MVLLNKSNMKCTLKNFKPRKKPDKKMTQTFTIYVKIRDGAAASVRACFLMKEFLYTQHDE